MFNKFSLSEQVEEALRAEITEGRVRPGQRVVLADYQESWNVSSTPFRDAVRALGEKGFLTIEPRKGVFVAQMNAQTMREIFEVRIALECVAVKLATARVPIERAEALRNTYQDIMARLANHDAVELTKDDRSVHELAQQYCGNTRLQRLLAEQSDHVRWAQNVICLEMPLSYEMAVPEHLAIVEAICARDAARASEEMRKHLENSRERIESRLPH